MYEAKIHWITKLLVLDFFGLFFCNWNGLQSGKEDPDLLQHAVHVQTYLFTILAHIRFITKKHLFPICPCLFVGELRKTLLLLQEIKQKCY